MKKFIIVSGNIGCGKSSLTDLLSKRLGWKPYYEVVENNPYLEDFYKDMKKVEFSSSDFFSVQEISPSSGNIKKPCLCSSG